MHTKSGTENFVSRVSDGIILYSGYSVYQRPHPQRRSIRHRHLPHRRRGQSEGKLRDSHREPCGQRRPGKAESPRLNKNALPPPQQHTVQSRPCLQHPRQESGLVDCWQTHFGIRDNQVVVRTVSSRATLEFNPRKMVHVATGYILPMDLLGNCVHFLNTSTGSLQVYRHHKI